MITSLRKRAEDAARRIDDRCYIHADGDAYSHDDLAVADCEYCQSRRKHSADIIESLAREYARERVAAEHHAFFQIAWDNEENWDATIDAMRARAVAAVVPAPEGEKK